MLKKATDLILYSNFYIAFCAVAMTLQSQFLLENELKYSPIVGLIFFSTLMIYAVHRIVGLFRLKDFLEEGRYLIINKFKAHIWIYATLGFVGSLYCFFQLDRILQLAIVFPAFFSLGYIFPVFGKKQFRLRDFNGVKIFLVAGVWSYVTVLLPALEIGIPIDRMIWMFIERFLFVFAITLPFDIRDLKVDQFNQVKTIPSTLGIKNTIKLAGLLLAIMLIIAFFMYEWNVLIGMVTIIGLTFYWIYISPKQTNDYFFTGLMDGTMILQPLVIYGFSFL